MALNTWATVGLRKRSELRVRFEIVHGQVMVRVHQGIGRVNQMQRVKTSRSIPHRSVAGFAFSDWPRYLPAIARDQSPG